MTNCETLIFGVFIFKCIEILGVDVYRCLFCIKSWLFYNRVLFLYKCLLYAPHVWSMTLS